MENLTPMLKQYQEIKLKHPHCILFFRLGDFYEMFGEDAKVASKILDLVLTGRDAGKAGKMPMCGIPFHAAQNYIAKLIKAGLKVAICEQVEDPALAKGLVKREVIRIISSGTYIDESNFESRVLAAIAWKENSVALSFTNLSDGIIYTNQYSSVKDAVQTIAKISVYELIVSIEHEQNARRLCALPILAGKTIALSPFEDWAFNTDLGLKTLTEHFKVHSLRGFGIENMPACIAASGALLEYIKQMSKTPARHIHKIQLYLENDFCFISPAATLGLELESLRSTIDLTNTSMGKRKLKEWIYQPLKTKQHIIQRQNAVKILRQNDTEREQIAKLLHGVSDLEKCLSRISCGIGQARDLLALRNALIKIPDFESVLSKIKSNNTLLNITDVPSIRVLLDKAINPDIPLSHPEGKVIKNGYNAQLDELRSVHSSAKDWLRDFQEREIKRSGINSLKVGFTSVFGYYIEISKANTSKAPSDYIRKQTLVNAERYITQELKDYEEKILTAEEKVLAIEANLIQEIMNAILDQAANLHIFFSDLSSIDCLYSLSMLSLKPGYILPVIVDDCLIDIKDGRHPVVETMVSSQFIPNDTYLNTADNHLVILTGPNMAGKSTFIRQTAILVIMSHMGSFIPATEARIGIIDKIFTRIGAHDEISKGQSTFMVEMSETAGILNNLSERSLVVLDEIGRGTSTFDGLSLAWAIAEYLAKNKTLTLFATHFHELNGLTLEFPGVKNFNVSVKEWNDEVIFLHKIVPGANDDSYGIYVAKIAGIPKEIIKRAQHILSKLEMGNNLQDDIQNNTSKESQLNLFDASDTANLTSLKKEIESIDINTLSPLDALMKLKEIKENLSHE